MGAVDEMAVHDGVRTKVFGEVGGASAVPAVPVTFFRLHAADDIREGVVAAGAEVELRRRRKR